MSRILVNSIAYYMGKKVKELASDHRTRIIQEFSSLRKIIYSQ